MVKYRKGDIVAVIDGHIQDPNAKPDAIWGWMRKTFYGKVSDIIQFNYIREIRLEIPSDETQIIGMFEKDIRMRKANFLECLLYKFISKRSFPESVFYLDKMIA